MNIEDINWPIYAIGTGISTHTEYNILYANNKIVDNKNLAGDTIGKRRLNINTEELFNFKKTFFRLSELIEYTRSKKKDDRKFVDSTGILFSYTKTISHKLLWRKISKVEQFSTFVVVELEKMPNTFEIPNGIWHKFRDNEVNYLGLLKYSDYFIIYDISDTYKKDTWRLV